MDSLFEVLRSNPIPVIGIGGGFLVLAVGSIGLLLVRARYHPEISAGRPEGIAPLPVTPSQRHPPAAEAPSPAATLLIPRVAPRSRPYLFLEADNRRFELQGERLFVGREPSSEILLENRTVSGRHALILQREGKVLIQDLGSANGTYLNEVKVQGRQAVEDGDRLRFGNVELTFRG